MSVYAILDFILSVEGLIVLCLLVGVGGVVMLALSIAWDEEYYGSYHVREALFHWDENRSTSQAPLGEDDEGPLVFYTESDEDPLSCRPVNMGLSAARRSDEGRGNGDPER